MRHIIILLLLLLPLYTEAQDDVSDKKETPPEINKAAGELEKSLQENDNYKIARNYESLAQELTDKEDLPKAEEYLQKALKIYTSASSVANRARVLRNLARNQELQGNYRAAAKNYKAAAETVTDLLYKKLNNNDYNRLTTRGKLSDEQYLNSNIRLLKSRNKHGEIADTYLQLAALSLKNNDSVKAMEQYANALPFAHKLTTKSVKIHSKLIDIQIAKKEYTDAISTIQNLLDIAQKAKDNTTRITRLRQLATVYFLMEDADSAVKALKESYNIAATNGQTFEARESLVQLVDYYKSTGDDSAGMELYAGFLQNLDRIILSDKSLTNEKTFRVTEERIRRLESEKAFKDELISRKNTFNYLLLGSVVLLLALIVFVMKALNSIKAKNKQIALQSLRLEMNPHFLFNSLNSVNQFIAQNDELAANKFLTSYSNLMRNSMENSNKDFVTLGNEIDNLTKYLELEHLRFKDKFRFEIAVDEQLDRESLWVPNMIIQPHLENAIWHGLRYKEEKGLLKLSFTLNSQSLIVTVDDNGIGPARSSALKTRNQKAHQSRGLTNTHERMALLNELHKTKMDFSVNEKVAPESGTIVLITLPIITKLP